MKGMSVGDAVLFESNTNQTVRGRVVELIVERRQPTMVLIEREDGGRAIRLEHEVRLAEEMVALAG